MYKMYMDIKSETSEFKIETMSFYSNYKYFYKICNFRAPLSFLYLTKSLTNSLHTETNHKVQRNRSITQNIFLLHLYAVVTLSQINIFSYINTKFHSISKAANSPP